MRSNPVQARFKDGGYLPSDEVRPEKKAKASDHIFHLPYVSAERLSGQDFPEFLPFSRHRSGNLGPEAAYEMEKQGNEVLRAFSQGGKAQSEGAQAVWTESSMLSSHMKTLKTKLEAPSFYL